MCNLHTPIGKIGLYMWFLLYMLLYFILKFHPSSMEPRPRAYLSDSIWSRAWSPGQVLLQVRCFPHPDHGSVGCGNCFSSRGLFDPIPHGLLSSVHEWMISVNFCSKDDEGSARDAQRICATPPGLFHRSSSFALRHV